MILLRTPIKAQLALTVGLMCSIMLSNAAIVIGPAGTSGRLTFGAAPVAADWAVLSVAGGNTTVADPAGQDAAVQVLTAGGITGTMASDGTVPTGTSASFRYNTTGDYINSRPTGNAYAVLKASLLNSSGVNATELFITYDMAELVGSLQEEVPGWRVYYSITGASNTWQLIPELSDGNTNPATKSVTVTLNGTWTNGTTMYVIWTDDNANNQGGLLEGAYTLDNVIFSTRFIPPEITIIQEPTAQSGTEGDSVTFSVLVTGLDPQFQWYQDGNPILDATNASYTIPVLYKSVHEGTYWVIVTNSLPSSDESLHVGLTITKDVIAPMVKCVHAGSNDNVTVSVIFSEPMTNALSPTSYTISPVGGGDNRTVTNAFFFDAEQTTVVLTLDGTTPLEPGVSYNIFVSAVEDRFGNVLENTPAIPIARFPTAVMLGINATHIWRYNDTATNLGTAWRAVGYDTSGWTGQGPALLGVETAAMPEPLRTPFAGYVAGAVRTFYFRTTFNFTENPADAVICLRPIIDDAAVFFLNGAEIFRLRMPAVYDFNTEGLGGAVGEAVYEGPFYVCVTNLVQGDNVLAVEVHQTGGASSDLVMGVEVSGLVPSNDPINITRDPISRTVAEGGTVTFDVALTGTNPRYQWYHNNNLIPGATGPTYTIPYVRRADAGQYHVVVQNDIPSSDTSAAATLTVLEDNTAPSIVCAYFGPNVGPSNTIIVEYSEAVTNALDTLGYFVEQAGGGGELSLAFSEYVGSTTTGKTVRLVLHESPQRTPGVPYNLTTSGICDDFGNCSDFLTVPIAAFPRTIMNISESRTWRYNDTGNTNLGTAWRAVGYNDTVAGWSSGSPVFFVQRDTSQPSGYTNRTIISGQPVQTYIALSNATLTAQNMTIYFRTHLTYSGSAGTKVICITPFVDDGAVFYLNGVEFFRTTNMPSGTILYGTGTTSTVGDATNTGPFYVCVTNLVVGDNVLAVEVHQANSTSSDIAFGLGLDILQTTPPSSLTISQSGGQVTLTWSGPAGSVLEAASVVTGPYSSGGVNQSQNQTFAPSGTQRFFRVREP